MTTQLQNINYSALPGENDPELLLINYQKRLLDGLKLHFQKLSQSAKIDLTRQMEALDKIDVTKRFSPSLYNIYVIIKEAYKLKNLETLLEGVQLFNNQIVEGFYAEDLQFSTTLTEHWEYFVKDSKQTTPHDEYGLAILNSVKIYPLVHWEKDAFPPPQLKEALQMFQSFDDLMFKEFVTYVSRMKIYSSIISASFTSPRFFGAIFIRIPKPSEDPILFFLETVVHELAHLHLFLIMAEDKVVLNREDEFYYSPLRVDKRPMLGIFHGTFVLACIVRILRKFFPSGHPILDERIKSFKEGLEAVKADGKLTENGQILFNSLERCAFE